MIIGCVVPRTALQHAAPLTQVQHMDNSQCLMLTGRSRIPEIVSLICMSVARHAPTVMAAFAASTLAVFMQVQPQAAAPVPHQNWRRMCKCPTNVADPTAKLFLHCHDLVHDLMRF